MALISRAYWQHVNPRGMIADFREVWRQAGSNRWRIAVLAAACTLGVFYVIAQEGGEAPHKPPEVIWISVLPAHRTDAEIMASNIANQKRKDALAKIQARQDEKVRDIYKSLGRVSGMDVDRIVAQADADKAAQAKADAEAFRKRLASDQAAEARASGSRAGGSKPARQPANPPSPKASPST